MNRSSFTWFTTFAVAAAGTFFAVRAGFPLLPAAALTEVPQLAKNPSDTTQTVAGQPEDLLLKRLRFLDRLGAADSAGLRQMFLDTGTSRQEKRATAQRWAESDPAGLLGFLKGLSRTDWARDGEQFDTVRGILFRTWAALDPEAALAAADALGTRPQFRHARWEIVQSLFGTDPAKAFAAAVKLPHFINADRVVDNVWKKDPISFLKAAGEAPRGAFKNEEVLNATVNAFGEWLKKDSTAAAAWLKALPLEQQRKLWGRMANQFAETDPAGAQAWFKDTPASAQREKAGAEIVKALAKKDPQAALEWLQDNLQGGRTTGFTYLAEALAEKGVDSAKQLMDAMPPGEQRDGVVRVIAMKWAEKDFKPAIAWVLSLPQDDPGRKEAMQPLIYRWAEKDLAGATAYLRDSASPREASGMMWSVSRQFIEKDLAGGFAWADTLTTDTKASAYGSFFQDAITMKKLPEVFAAMEKLPAAQQQEIAGNIATIVINNGYTDSGQDAGFVHFLKLIPPQLRQAARDGINQNGSDQPEKKQAALEALK